MKNQIRANTLLTEDAAQKEVFWKPFTDIHCHCLPAFDDGPTTLNQSISLCETLIADGIGTVVATPHFLGAYDGNANAATVREAVNCLNQILWEDGMGLTVLAGAEVRVDERICQLLEDDIIPTIGDGGQYILLELPHEVFIDIDLLLTELSSGGITALIGHPERNVPLMQQSNMLFKWVENGALLQITAASLIGDYGPEAKRSAWYLVANNLVSVVATDAHNAHHACPRMSAAFTLVAKQFGEELARLLCIENPSRIVAGLDIKPTLENHNEVVNR